MSTSSNTASVELSDLSQQDQDIYLSERMKMFKITIAVCAVYGLIAVLLLLVGLFTSFGQKYLYDRLFPFVFTFIIGTVIIIVYLSNEIYNFKPTNINKGLSIDSEMCPDYWRLEAEDITKFNDSQNKSYLPADVNINHFRYKCVADKELFPTDNIMSNDDGTFQYTKSADESLYISLNDENNKITGTNIEETITPQFKNFKKYMANMNGYNLTDDGLIAMNENSLKNESGIEFETYDPVPISCDKVYPLFLSMMDKKNVSDNPTDPSNKFRCDYAKQCGVPWTDAGCF